MASLQPVTGRHVELIINAISEKLGDKQLVCPLSGDDNWAVERYFGKIPAAESLEAPSSNERESRSFPFAVLTCQTCGFSFFVNVFRLGLAEALGIEAAE